jgi:predicted nucleotidyltransferase
MVKDELKSWCATLASWAEGKNEIFQLWLFGSCARGDNRSDSDLDVAVILSPGCESARLTDWIVLSNEWRPELAELLNDKYPFGTGRF